MFQIGELYSAVIYSVLYLPEHIHYTHSRQSAKAWHFCFAALSNQILWERKDHRQESITVSILKREHGKTVTKALFIAFSCSNTQLLCCLAARVWCWDLTQHCKQGVLFLIQTLVHSVTWLYCFSSLYKHYL